MSDTVLNVDERTNSYPVPSVDAPEQAGLPDGPIPLDYWVGVGERTAVAYSDLLGVPRAIGVVHYSAPLTASGLREDLVLGELTTIEDWMPRWWPNDGAPPGPDELRRRFRRASGRTMAYIESVEVHPRLERKPGQSPDDFYAEVAKAYRLFPSKPTQGVAFAGMVPHTTAAKWVREARRRGFLPPFQKGSAHA